MYTRVDYRIVLEKDHLNEIMSNEQDRPTEAHAETPKNMTIVIENRTKDTQLISPPFCLFYRYQHARKGHVLVHQTRKLPTLPSYKQRDQSMALGLY